MAQITQVSKKVTLNRGSGKRTSIGRGRNSRPTGKHARKSYKKYRGQGFP